MISVSGILEGPPSWFRCHAGAMTDRRSSIGPGSLRGPMRFTSRCTIPDRLHGALLPDGWATAPNGGEFAGGIERLVGAATPLRRRWRRSCSLIGFEGNLWSGSKNWTTSWLSGLPGQIQRTITGFQPLQCHQRDRAGSFPDRMLVAWPGRNPIVIPTSSSWAAACAHIPSGTEETGGNPAAGCIPALPEQA